MTNFNVFTVLTNLKKVFARRMVTIDTETREFYLVEGVSFDDAEQMLVLMENLHSMVGFENAEDEMAFYGIKEKFYRDIDRNVELFRSILMVDLTDKVLNEDAVLNIEDEMDMLGIHSPSARSRFKEAQEDKNHPAAVAARKRFEEFMAKQNEGGNR